MCIRDRGNHIFFLTRLPSPTLISEALSEIKPDILYAVPLVVDKIVRKEVFPQRPYEVVVGGAPLNKEIENFFISGRARCV